MRLLAKHAGTWAGSNAFRLMPSDEPFVAPAAAAVSVGSGGSAAVISYTWSHPKDGEQDGLLTVGASEEPGGVVGLWSDSWHQSPASVVVVGRADGQVLSVGYDYAGDWGWRITVDAAAADALRLRMDNVVPASAATAEMPPGAYAAMDLFAGRRAAGIADRG